MSQKRIDENTEYKSKCPPYQGRGSCMGSRINYGFSWCENCPVIADRIEPKPTPTFVCHGAVWTRPDCMNCLEKYNGTRERPKKSCYKSKKSTKAELYKKRLAHRKRKLSNHWARQWDENRKEEMKLRRKK